MVHIVILGKFNWLKINVMTDHLSTHQVFTRKLTDIIIANLRNENFGVKQLIHESGLSRYCITRNLHAITHKTISQFIRETRLLMALEMLKDDEVTAAEIAYKVGFSSPTYFNKCFHEYFGYPPGRVKKGDCENKEEFNYLNVTTEQGKKITSSRTLFITTAGIMFLAAIIYLGYNDFLITLPANTGGPLKNPIKSIAVLPFNNLSDSTTTQGFIDGVMEEILTNLSRVHDLRVISRTSVEQFRESIESATEIGKKLDVEYIVEGSGQKYGNAFRLRVQLIEASKDNHIWAESYEQDIQETKDIFRIQSQIAQSIAAELKARITPEEKQLIEKIPTANLMAYDFYKRGEEEIRKYISDNSNKQTLKRAEEMYNKALELDSTYAKAYIGLAYVYLNKHGFDSYYTENYLDSVFILADRALSYDDHLAEAFLLRGNYYLHMGKTDKAINEYDKALNYNPNYWEVYWNKGWMVYLMDYKNMDFVKAMECLHKSISINRGTDLPDYLRNLGEAYGYFIGFSDKSEYYYQEALKLDGDTTKYYLSSAEGEHVSRNYKKAIELYKKCYLQDSDNVDIISKLAYDYCMIGQFNESLKYTKKYEKRLEAYPPLFYSGSKQIGYVYWLNGNKTVAEQWFNKQKRISEESIKMGRFYSTEAAYDLAALYAFRGEKDKAYENLKIVAEIHVCPWWLLGVIKDDPLLNSIRNEPEFQEILYELEAKYNAEHERVRKWLDEQEIL